MREIVIQPDWGALEEQIGFPCILKPVDGYAWQDVFRVEGPAALRSLYESLKDRRTLIVQQLVQYESLFPRLLPGTKDVYIVRWTPQPFDLGEYSLRDGNTKRASGDHHGEDDCVERRTRA